jgi:hypothetical protein
MSAATKVATSGTSSGGLVVLACKAGGQPRSFRLAPTQRHDAAYRRLALAMLGLDVATLTYALQSARRATTVQQTPPDPTRTDESRLVALQSSGRVGRARVHSSARDASPAWR